MFNKDKLNKLELCKILEEKKNYETSKSVSIEALKIVQRTRGWISDNMMQEIAKVLCISESSLEEIATFYNQIYRRPVGRHIIRYCDSVVCYMLGYKHVVNKLKTILNICPGQTTCDNRFTILPVSCLGSCDKAPVIMINENTYSRVNTDGIPILLEKYK
ncbi:NADH-quinone oxidoreductase subunit NuoE [Buchnera aphidicola]|uniref:NADH-quinone oxidoreductase subunit E n=1 Tax=Buchnera aphidicola (Stegophylla sp.) TaxID=2315800 RepID=A0A4D6YK32_9GAMM|nr:NADH-quinone oxidoreductase subunit NuoE [Buchnera aphidicola (Stegophylla sp.)]QCI26294.1 NADH-quinone oxidoreductase subunit NuoE [Buchnera aphidicola (Stegophylla sp.)]